MRAPCQLASRTLRGPKFTWPSEPLKSRPHTPASRPRRPHRRRATLPKGPVGRHHLAAVSLVSRRRRRAPLVELAALAVGGRPLASYRLGNYGWTAAAAARTRPTLISGRPRGAASRGRSRVFADYLSPRIWPARIARASCGRPSFEFAHQPASQPASCIRRQMREITFNPHWHPSARRRRCTCAGWPAERGPTRADDDDDTNQNVSSLAGLSR
jgi:hypothetical protein